MNNRTGAHKKTGNHLGGAKKMITRYYCGGEEQYQVPRRMWKARRGGKGDDKRCPPTLPHLPYPSSLPFPAFIFFILLFPFYLFSNLTSPYLSCHTALRYFSLVLCLLFYSSLFPFYLPSNLTSPYLSCHTTPRYLHPYLTLPYLPYTLFVTFPYLFFYSSFLPFLSVLHL